MSTENFSVDCRRCPRLAGFLDEVADRYPDYHARPVPPFGDDCARLLIVGLAPGMHGANATGRPFTGDYAGILLYQTLFDLGLASQPDATAVDDGLELYGCRITNAVKCLPPENKPTGSEINTCNDYLASELESLPDSSVVLALGTIAHRAVLKARKLKLSAFPFAHGAEHRLENFHLVDSYHCSRYNTQTRRLNQSMFLTVLRRAKTLAGLD
ncbi:MAG: uracil-DNA glycosylase [Gammaproteobacteria bacterium]|nr:uracil-DNA glycosylase [Gammaproteobacteria bacterium]MCZ6912485.1 uracil-DNA glycosylase [Pseudomonadota bacterium]